MHPIHLRSSGYATNDWFSLAMTATAMSLTMASLRSEGHQQTRAATGIVTPEVLDNIASLALGAVGAGVLVEAALFAGS